MAYNWAAGKCDVVSDKQNAAYFYGTDGNGALYVSADGGQTFTQTATLAGANGALAVNFAAAGDLWIGGKQLYHSIDFGKTWNAVYATGLNSATQIALGAAPPAGGYQAIYIWGREGW